jgi:hypothetical protein
MHPALAYARQIAYSSEEVLQFSYDQAVKYKDSPGVYVECGVAAGAQIIAMAAGAPNKTIYAFDSFEGIPLASNKDDQAPGLHFFTKAEQMALPNPGEQVLISSGAVVVSKEEFINHLITAKIYSDNIIVWKGWFEDTTVGFPKGHQISPIQILRLDGDLYNSTYVCLSNLYPFVAKGGLVIVDDWALPGCRQAVVDYFAIRPSDTFKKWRVSVKFIEGNDYKVAYWKK